MFSDVPRISSTTKNMTMPTNSSVIYNTTTSAYEYFDGVAWVPFTNFRATGEPTGFPLDMDGQIDTERSTITFTNLSRTFSIVPTVDYFYFYHSGREFKKINAENNMTDKATSVVKNFIKFRHIIKVKKSKLSERFIAITQLKNSLSLFKNDSEKKCPISKWRYNIY